MFFVVCCWLFLLFVVYCLIFVGALSSWQFKAIFDLSVSCFVSFALLGVIWLFW